MIEQLSVLFESILNTLVNPLNIFIITTGLSILGLVLLWVLTILAQRVVQRIIK